MFFSPSRVRQPGSASARRTRSAAKARSRTRFLRFDSLESRNLLASVVGDFNGDGFADQAVGVPGEDIGSIANAGAVHVIYGSLFGLTTRNDYWHQNRAGVPDTAETGDEFGAAVAAGDFNDDGYSDLAIGSPGESIGAAASTGAVFVIYGSPTGLNAGATAVRAVDFLSQGAATDNSLNDLLDVGETDDRFGSSLATGNFTADVDGTDDLVIGVPNENNSAGIVHIVYGTAAGLSATGQQLFSQNSTNIEGTSSSNELFGLSLVTGYFNGDDNADLAIGVPLDGGGAVNVIYSAGAAGLSATAVSGVGADDQIWDQGILLDTPESGDAFGYSLAAGDFNADGIGDLAVGIPGENAGTVDDGAVSIIFGQFGGLSASGEWLLTQDNSGEINEVGDQFGFSLAAGDFDGNGFTDIAIGIPLEEVDGIADAGAVIVRYNGIAPQLWSQNSADVPGISQVSDQLGYALSAGDYNGDGVPDLSIGVPGDNVGNIDNAGAMNVIYGNPLVGSTGLSATFIPAQIWDQQRLGQGVAEAQDRFGGNLAASSAARVAPSSTANAVAASAGEPAGEAPSSAPLPTATSKPEQPAAESSAPPATSLQSVRSLLVGLFASSRRRRG